MLEGQRNDRRVDDLDLLDLLFEGLAVVLVPLGDLNIQDVIFQLLYRLKMLLEHLLQVLERDSPLFTFCSTENRKFGQSKLHLALAYFLKVAATLNESFIFSVDGILFVVISARRLFVAELDDHSLHLF